ncbi:MAG: DUF4258 domain-containing protein [Leptolyngbyaceae bacterium]|nr:DUF4258 domain-containing protein [Leptolyngbyaceae bacterium]
MTDEACTEDILFEVETPLGFCVRTTISYWELITTVKHPIMRGRESDVQQTLIKPDAVHLSKSDPQVYLFYRADGTQRWVCAVTRRLKDQGFLITAYRTGAIKEGVLIWPK